MNQMSEQARHVQNFLSALGPASHAYTHAEVAMVALKDGGTIPAVLHCSVRLLSLPEVPGQRFLFESHHICGIRDVVPCESDIPTMLDDICKTMRIGLVGPLAELRPSSHGGTDTYFLTPSQRQLRQGKRILRLSFFGQSIQQMLFPYPELAAELQSEKIPFESLTDLYSAVQLMQPTEDRSFIEIQVMPVAEITSDSHIENRSARIIVRASPKADLEKIRLGWRVIREDIATSRASIDGGGLRWADDRSALHQFEVPEGVSLQCWLSYAGKVQHEAVVYDHASVVNPRRIAHACVDEGCEHLEALLFDPKVRKQNRGFERGIGYLFHLLGFRAERFEKPLEDAPDLIVEAPNGSFLMIECSTDRADTTKVSKLRTRCDQVRASLTRSGFGATPVVPILVCARLRAEIQPEAEDARARGVALLAAEDLRHLMDLSQYRTEPHAQVLMELEALVAPRSIWDQLAK